VALPGQDVTALLTAAGKKNVVRGNSMGVVKRWFKRGAIGMGVLVLVAGTGLVVAAQFGERKMDRRIEVQVAAVAARTDPQSIERGRYLYRSRGCMDCHDEDGGGKVVIDDGGLLVKAPGITRAPGSVVAAYSDLDWTRTIRHGVKPDGRPVMIMPSEDYNRLTDQDLGSLLGYLRQMPAARADPAVLQLPMPVKALYAVGAIHDAAGKIDHRLPPAQPVPEGATVEHGAYVANACIGCHGPRLEGGRIPGAPPDWPPASNLRSASDGPMRAYPDATAFGAMFKTGKRPDGSEVSTVMPFLSLKEMNDLDVQALFLYLRSLSAGG
jgi:mono/diheme cytochrome c family protein